MKKQLLIIGIFTILLSVGFSGCNETTNSLKSDRDKLVGTWTVTEEDVTATMICYSDGTMFITAMGITGSGTYEFKDGKLVLTSQLSGAGTYDYFFSNDGKELTLRKLGSDVDIFCTKQ